MKYFVVNIQRKDDDTTANSIFAYGTREEALSVYHSTLAYNYASTELKAFSVIVLNEYGGTEIFENFEKHEEEIEE